MRKLLVLIVLAAVIGLVAGSGCVASLHAAMGAKAAAAHRVGAL